MMFENFQDVLTVEEIAQILRLNERTVLKLAEEGQLPAAKIASEFRFSKEKILEWLDLRLNQYSDGLLADMEKGILEKAIPIHKLLLPSHIKLEMESQNKEQVLVELTDLADDTGLVRNKRTLLQYLQNRENLCPTAVDNEIAFPHPREANWRMVRHLIIVLGIARSGIDFDASDGKPVKIFVMLAIPVLSLHLQIISRLARIFNDSLIKEKICQAKTASEIIEIIRKKEEPF